MFAKAKFAKAKFAKSKFAKPKCAKAKTVKAKVLKVKFQNLGENQAEAHFKWNHASGDYMPVTEIEQNLPWE